jgi:hypothetical protein
VCCGALWAIPCSIIANESCKKALKAHQTELNKPMSASKKQGSQSVGKTKRAHQSKGDEDACAAAEALHEQQHIAAMQKQQASGTAVRLERMTLRCHLLLLRGILSCKEL